MPRRVHVDRVAGGDRRSGCPRGHPPAHAASGGGHGDEDRVPQKCRQPGTTPEGGAVTWDTTHGGKGFICPVIGTVAEMRVTNQPVGYLGGRMEIHQRFQIRKRLHFDGPEFPTDYFFREGPAE